MTYLALFAQVMPTRKMPPIPMPLVYFAIGALVFAAVWMGLLVRHAAREEREYRAKEQGSGKA
jgi:hypothetical protein